MMTRRGFIRDLALAGFGIQRVHEVVFSAPDVWQSSTNLDKLSFVMHYLGVTETAIRNGEAVKALLLADRILRAEEQCNGSIIISGCECFLVEDGKYLLHV